ncbi:MAG: antibiotic biosynthesis monooxygenase [Desulfatiglans sp.]|jgi:quinol monooxygenase YgiN|nr:antibiotic biosynthesis monooxygenase [Desulfatiglans sp.]
MINVIATVHVKKGKVQEFLKLFKTIVPKVRAEKGCINYFPAVDFKTGLPPQELDENMVTIMERWESLEDLINHISAPYMAEHLEKEKDLVEKSSIKILKEA